MAGMRAPHDARGPPVVVDKRNIRPLETKRYRLEMASYEGTHKSQLRFAFFPDPPVTLRGGSETRERCPQAVLGERNPADRGRRSNRAGPRTHQIWIDPSVRDGGSSIDLVEPTCVAAGGAEGKTDVGDIAAVAADVVRLRALHLTEVAGRGGVEVGVLDFGVARFVE